MAGRLENLDVCVTADWSTDFDGRTVRRVDPRIRCEDHGQRDLHFQSIQHSITHRPLRIGADVEQIAKGELAGRLLRIAMIHVLGDGPVVLLDDILVLLDNVRATLAQYDWPKRTGDSDKCERLKAITKSLLCQWIMFSHRELNYRYDAARSD